MVGVTTFRSRDCRTVLADGDRQNYFGPAKSITPAARLDLELVLLVNT